VRPPRALLAAAAILGAALALVACGSANKSKTKTVVRTVATRTNPTTNAPTLAGGGIGVTGAGTAGTPGAASTLTPGIAGSAGLTGTTGVLGIIRPFNAQSPWNTQVTGQQVDANSDALIRAAELRIGVQERGNVISTQRRRINTGLFINTTKWTTPIVDEQGGVPTRVICRQIPPDCGDGSTVNTLLIPPNERPLPQYDGWFTVLNRREGVAFDMWRARRAAGNGDVISYQFMRKWALNGPGFQDPGTKGAVSARGSGLPLFAGVILPEEIQAGRIDHALAISLPGPAQRNYVQPASSTDGNGRITSLPEGARIRLRAGTVFHNRDCPALRRGQVPRPRFDCLPSRTSRKAARAIFQALRTYGAIVVDRSRNPTLYAKQNFNWTTPLRGADGRLLDERGRPLRRSVRRLPNQATPRLRGSEVQFLRLSDFEVISLPPILKFPPLNSTPTAPIATFTPGIP